MVSKRRRAALVKARAASIAARREATAAADKALLPLLRRLRADGLSYGAIAERLNEQGRLTRTGGRHWHATTVYRVLVRGGEAGTQ